MSAMKTHTTVNEKLQIKWKSFQEDMTVLGAPRPPSGLTVCWKDSQHSAYSYAPGQDLFRQNQQKEERPVALSQETTGRKLPRDLSQGSHTGHGSFLQEQAVTTWVECCPPDQLRRDPAPKVCNGACHISILPSVYQNSRLPGGGQVCN